MPLSVKSFCNLLLNGGRLPHNNSIVKHGECHRLAIGEFARPSFFWQGMFDQLPDLRAHRIDVVRRIELQRIGSRDDFVGRRRRAWLQQISLPVCVPPAFCAALRANCELLHAQPQFAKLPISPGLIGRIFRLAAAIFRPRVSCHAGNDRIDDRVEICATIAS